jgi:hypothetical protein
MSTANLNIEKLTTAQAQKEPTINEAFDSFDAAIGSDFIRGLKLEWLSSSSIKVNTGAAGLPSGGMLTAAAITVTSISLGSNTWGHVYLYNSGSSSSPVAAIEVVTTAPVSYFGSAYQKTGDASRRYLGSIRTNGSGNIFSFIHQGDRILYREQLNASPFRVLNAGTATVETSVVCTAVVPVTTRIALLRIVNTSTAQGASMGTSDDNTSNLVRDIYTNTEQVGETPLDSSQALTYKFVSAPGVGGALYMDVVGYRFER